MVNHLPKQLYIRNRILDLDLDLDQFLPSATVTDEAQCLKAPHAEVAKQFQQSRLTKELRNLKEAIELLTMANA